MTEDRAASYSPRAAAASPPAGDPLYLSDRDWRRSMARFEIGRARKLRAEGRPDRAAVALKRARWWLRESRTAAAPGGVR